MSQFYDLASLVVIPSGYKASTIYAQKPLTTDGQLSFSRASTATRVNASGLIEAVASNVPRLDYTNSSCPRLLLEPQRTNLYPYSEQLNQWTASGSTVTSNYAVSPDGYTNADRVQFTAGSVVFYSGTGSAGTNTISVYAKATNGVSGQFRFFGNGATTLSTDQTATGEWQRFTFTYTYSAVTAGLAAPTTGGGVSDVIFWGFQHEIGAYATSYIPTLGASVTRVADAASKTGISSLIGQTEGTVFVDFNINGLQSLYASAISLNDGAANNYIWLTIFANGNLRAEVWNGAVQAQISYTGAVAGGRYKMAFGYKTNDFVLYVNGSVVGTDTSGTTFSGTTLSQIDNTLAGLVTNECSQSMNQALLFKTRLTNAQLAELTAL
jgi:hypothetical protein